MANPAFDLVVSGGNCVTPAGIVAADIGVRDGRIAAIGALGTDSAREVMNAAGLHLLPGVIDTQVHFREPGNEHKEDLATGSTAAVLGGVTAVFEMPNTAPPTVNAAALRDKLTRAKARMRCDYAFYVGASPDNAELLGELELIAGCAGVKLFMGSSTGSLLVADDETLARVLRSGRRRVAIHAEDEPRLKARFDLVAGGAEVARHPEWRDVETAVLATRRLIGIARAARRRVHVLHVSTGDEMQLLAEARDVATVEVTPQHLTLAAPDCYRLLGTRAQMNPPIRDAEHRAALWRAVASGLVDIIGSDHAPHTLAEKARPYPQSPSGMPGVQTLVPIMLDHVHAGRLTLERLVDLISAGPARAFGIVAKGRIAIGYDADLTVVDLAARRRLSDADMASRVGWTPYDGQTVTGWPIATILRGRIVMRDGEDLGAPIGRPINFGPWPDAPGSGLTSA